MVCDSVVRGFLKRAWRSVILPALVLAGVLAFPGYPPSGEETPDVIILHSGRIRGNVYPLSLQSLAPLQHYQYLSGYVRKVRDEAAKTGARVLLVDLGDSLTGSFAAHVTGSENMVTFFNETGYDAVLLSNLDNDVQPATLAKLRAKVLNPFADAAGQPATKGSVFGTKVDLPGTPVFLLANFYGDASREKYPERFPTRFGSSPAAVVPVRDYSKVLAGLGERPPNSLTLLSWMKFESPTKRPEAFLQQLQSLGVDAILAHRIYGGNERDVWTSSGFLDWQPPVSVNILRNNGGFALSRLDLKRSGDGWKVLRHQLLPMTANTAPADVRVVENIARFAPAIAAADARLADLPDTVSAGTILKIYLGALAAVPGTDAALYSLQSIRNDWPAGELRASEVFNSLPWTTPIVQVTLTPEQMAAVAKELGLVAVENEAVPEGPLTVTTSQFFGRLIAAKLGLPADALRDTGQKSEFDYFVAYLKTQPDLSGGAPAGWKQTAELAP
jgi:2',3'-cyclic-nucleotide 2'-phosphodiesterase (5'-nucleotidase family)